MESDERRRDDSTSRAAVVVEKSDVVVTPSSREGDVPSPDPVCYLQRGQVAPDDDPHRYFSSAEQATAEQLEALYPSIRLVSIDAMDGVYGKAADALAGGRAVELKRIAGTAQPVTAAVKQVRRALGQTNDLVVVDAREALLSREEALRALTLSAARYGATVSEILIIYSAEADVAAVGWAREQ
ncbi:hypothetical protein [Gordonia rhizosphera]|nr:hypothetical protein [Gordonia rhizosphera]